MNNGDDPGIDINYSAAIDAALKEAAGNEENLEDPTASTAGQDTEEQPAATTEDISQYMSQEEMDPPEDTKERAPEEELTIEERLDDLQEIVMETNGLIKSLVGIMEKQGTSIDSIGSRVVEAVQTVMSHSGAKLPPAAPKPEPAEEKKEEASEGPSEAEQENLKTITALKERRS